MVNVSALIQSLENELTLANFNGDDHTASIMESAILGIKELDRERKPNHIDEKADIALTKLEKRVGYR